ncbi:uncharacterized protein LOC112001909 [Quercus suber]|uniref:uncharacterized protein LOC112001909 n=1 Tax=Quercus suber TaxID=58331 RepID=UPI000CE24A1E|nr:uncharacterized protein LOC112001909 [Quercus suber]
MNLDGILRRTDSPFTPSVLECPLPPKFRLPQLEFYNSTKDPLDHIRAFKTILNLQQTPDEVICRLFPTTLRGAARVWFSKLPASSIENFEQLSDSFVHHFIDGQRHKRPTSYLLTVRQQEGESLRDYVKRFNKAVLEIDEADDQVIITTFQAGLNNPDFIFSLGKTPPTSMTNLLFKAQKYMNGEDALTAKGLMGKRKKDETSDSHGKKRDRKDLYSDTKTSKSSLDAPRKRKSFTPLVMPADKILMQINDEPGLKWPKPLSTSLRKRDPKKYCRFHKDYGHYIDECRDLKDQIEELIQRGKLQKFMKRDHQPQLKTEDKNHDAVKGDGRDHPKQVVGEIRTIVGGPVSGGLYKSLKKTYYRQVNSVHMKHSSQKYRRSYDDDITFSKRDASGIKQPYDDSLVITLEVEGFATRRVLVDNGSLADIMYMTAYQQLRLDPKRLRSFNSPLVSSSGDKIYLRGIVTLSVTTGTYPTQVTIQADFLVVNCPSSYNVILGRPTLNKLKAVTSTYCLKVKFPTPNGVGQLFGDQLLARECYQVVLASKESHTWVVEEESKESSQELEEVHLVDGEMTKVTKVGTGLSTALKSKIVEFLKQNLDVFAWTHEDMPGIENEVIEHKLNVDPAKKPVQQRRRTFALEQNKAIMEEVDKLLTAGFIREIYYPEWLANVVMVKKSNGKWRMCVDFTDLNRACLRTVFPSLGLIS